MCSPMKFLSRLWSAVAEQWVTIHMFNLQRTLMELFCCSLSVSIFFQCILVSEEDEEATFVEKPKRGRCFLILYVVGYFLIFSSVFRSYIYLKSRLLSVLYSEFILIVQVLRCFWSIGWILKHWLWCFNWNCMIPHTTVSFLFL